jgi:hypothetical protein
MMMMMMTNTGQIFKAVAFVSVISSPKQSWPCRRSPIVLKFRDTENIFTGNRTQIKFFGVLVFVSVISSSKQTTLVLALFFYRA